MHFCVLYDYLLMLISMIQICFPFNLNAKIVNENKTVRVTIKYICLCILAYSTVIEIERDFEQESFLGGIL